jgi:hypothetical protein
VNHIFKPFFPWNPHFTLPISLWHAQKKYVCRLKMKAAVLPKHWYPPKSIQGHNTKNHYQSTSSAMWKPQILYVISNYPERKFDVVILQGNLRMNQVCMALKKKCWQQLTMLFGTWTSTKMVFCQLHYYTVCLSLFIFHSHHWMCNWYTKISSLCISVHMFCSYVHITNIKQQTKIHYSKKKF